MARRPDRLLVIAPLVDTGLAWLTAARDFFFFAPPADPFRETEVLPTGTFFVWRFFFRLAFTFAKRLPPRKQRVGGSPKTSRGSPSRERPRAGTQRLVNFAVAADYTDTGPRLPGVFEPVTAEIRSTNI